MCLYSICCLWYYVIAYLWLTIYIFPFKSDINQHTTRESGLILCLLFLTHITFPENTKQKYINVYKQHNQNESKTTIDVSLSSYAGWWSAPQKEPDGSWVKSGSEASLMCTCIYCGTLGWPESPVCAEVRHFRLIRTLMHLYESDMLLNECVRRTTKMVKQKCTKPHVYFGFCTNTLVWKAIMAKTQLLLFHCSKTVLLSIYILFIFLNVCVCRNTQLDHEFWPFWM